MVQEAYCSFEVSKLLKEKGFNGLCGACFDPNDKSLNTIYYDTSGGVEPQDWNNLSEREAGKIGLATWYGYISAPTHQMAMKWLREKHNILITIIPQEFKVGIDALCYGIYRITEDLYQPLYNGKVDNLIDSYEDAVEAALKYCLENVI